MRGFRFKVEGDKVRFFDSGRLMTVMSRPDMVEFQGVLRRVRFGGETPANALIAEITEAFRTLGEPERVFVLRKILEETAKDPELRRKALCAAAKVVDGADEVELWMESRFRRDMSLMPRRVAAEAVKIRRAPKDAMPMLVALAERIKDKLRKREARL